MSWAPRGNSLLSLGVHTPCGNGDTAYLQRRNGKPGAIGVLGNGNRTMNSLPIIAGICGLGVFCAVALKGLLASR